MFSSLSGGTPVYLAVLLSPENGTTPGSHQEGSALSNGKLEAEDSTGSDGFKHTSPTQPGAGMP
jgi:hypothetical protein